MLRWLIGIILGEIICESSNWQHIQSLKITILGANWQLLDRIGLLNVHVLFCLHNNQVLLILMPNNRHFCCQFGDTIEVYFLFGINNFGVFILNGLRFTRKPQLASNLFLNEFSSKSFLPSELWRPLETLRGVTNDTYRKTKCHVVQKKQLLLQLTKTRG